MAVLGCGRGGRMLVVNLEIAEVISETEVGILFVVSF